MTLARKLERLARIVPGIGGYQDRESARDTDKAVRLRIAGELDGVRRELETLKRRLVAERRLESLPGIDLADSKIDRLANTIRYAERGYRGVFGDKTPLQPTLDALCDFDLTLLDEVGKLRETAGAASAVETDALAAALDGLHASIDDFEKTFDGRRRLLD